jgi:D-alanyl-D-alanine carboxypeptidase/D-alanyl-D-alanine-endopeptidase (penicillin-binding protein 4)
VQARVSPDWAPVDVHSRLALSDTACADWDDDWRTPAVALQPDGRWRVELQGAFPKNCSRQLELNLIGREDVADWAVRQLWAQLGGRIDGATVEAAAPPGARVLAVHRSRPLAELLRGINKRSDNPLTRLLYLRLGVDSPYAASDVRTDEAAALVVRDWFRSQSIDATGLVLDNGSGLSRSERISPAQLAALLQAAYRGPYAPELLASLPIAGRDGTMALRLKDSPAAGRARIKTGSLNQVAAVAGFVPDAQARWWVVVATINHANARQGRPVLDALIDWVARQGG